MCNCGQTSGQPAESYVVTRADGNQKTFDSRVEADIEKTKSGGVITVTRK